MIYFLFGKDTYRSRQKLNQIIERYKKRHQSGLNFIDINLEEQDLQDFEKAIKTVSMFDEKKLIVVKGAFKQSDNLQQKLLDHLKKRKLIKDQNTIIVFWVEQVDLKNELAQFLNKKAKTQKFELLSSSKLKKWTEKYIQQQEGKIDAQAIRILIEYIGNDLWRMSNEIDKLLSYKSNQKDKQIKAEDIQQLVKPEIDINIFNIIDALGEKNKKRALKLTQDYLKQGGDEQYLFNRFVYQFRNLIKIRQLLDQKHPVYLLSKKANIHPFVAKKTSYQARNFNFEDLKNIYNQLLEIDIQVKTGKLKLKPALEIFLAQL